MNISSRCEYACRALLELATTAAGQQPTPSLVIAERRQIPEKYLVHILLQLKRAGLVRSLRGAQGGYVLARDAGEITLLDIVEAIDGPLFQPMPGAEPASRELLPAWTAVAGEVSAVLKSITLGAILEQASGEAMYYI